MLWTLRQRNSSRPCSKTISIQGTPGFSVLSCPQGTLNSGDGAREAQPMIRYSRQFSTYVRGWGDALHPWEIRTCCTERACLAWMGLVPGSGVGREPGALLGRSYQPRSSCVFTWGHAQEEWISSACGHLSSTKDITQLTHFQMQRFWILLPLTVLQNLPRSQGQPFLAFCLHHDRLPLPPCSCCLSSRSHFLTLPLSKFPPPLRLFAVTIWHLFSPEWYLVFKPLLLFWSVPPSLVSMWSLIIWL